MPYKILNINHKKELLRGLWVHQTQEFLPTELQASVLPSEPRLAAVPLCGFCLGVLLRSDVA